MMPKIHTPTIYTVGGTVHNRIIIMAVVTHLWDHVSEVDGLCAADGGGSMVIYQLVKRVELYHP